MVFLMVFRPNGLLGGVNVIDLVLRKLGVKPRGALREQEEKQ